jgi:hypothetical protein
VSVDQFTIEQADEISRIVRDSLHPGFAPGDDTLTGIDIRPMADGSGDWAVFVGTYDAAGREHTFRHVVNAAGVSRESLIEGSMGRTRT